MKNKNMKRRSQIEHSLSLSSMKGLTEEDTIKALLFFMDDIYRSAYARGYRRAKAGKEPVKEEMESDANDDSSK